MLNLDDIMALTPEEFAKNWNDNTVQDSSLKLIGDRAMTPEETAHTNPNQ